MKKLKEFWSSNKERFIYTAKFTLFSIITVMGFWLTYGIIWFATGLPQTDWALWTLFGLSVASEYFYIKLLIK